MYGLNIYSALLLFSTASTLDLCSNNNNMCVCLTLCNPMDCSLPGFSVRGILQTRIQSGLPCPYPGDLPNPGIKPTSLTSPELAARFFTTSTTWEASVCSILVQNHRECQEKPLGDSPDRHLISLPPFFCFSSYAAKLS